MNRKQRRIIRSQDKYKPVIHLHGRSYTIEEASALAIKEHNLRNVEVAAEIYNLIIAKVPDRVEAYNNRGVILYEMKRYDDALANFEKAIALKPDYAEAYLNRGAAQRDLQQFQAAVHSYDKAIALKPDYAEAYLNRGFALHDLEQYQAAVDSYDKAIAFKPDYARAFFSGGNALRNLRQHHAAVDSYNRAIAFKPDYFEAYLNRGAALNDLKQYQAAVDSCNRVIALKPDLALAHYNLGHALRGLHQHQVAAESYATALAIDPDLKYGLGLKMHSQLHICDWSHYADDVQQIRVGVREGKLMDMPFSFLAISHLASEQQECAKSYMIDKYPAAASALWQGERYSHAKIRVAYVSADFREHPVSFMMAGLFEQHDKTRFELYGISLIAEDKTATGQRVKAAFDHFIDVSQKSDEEVAQFLRDLEIDIAVDLMGFTANSRTHIFACRAAPVQINYFGYTATMGADYIDYIIADQTVIPEEHRQYYTEKMAYLPDSFQVNDSSRKISEKIFTRQEMGLPEDGFVFCCFNKSFKITPDVFAIWMRLLHKIDGSVLWLFVDNPAAAKNLRAEARARGITDNRLVFADRMDHADHMARHRLADLFLDSFYFNAHSTASDALWEGLPVLTCPGEALASRVAASLLNAVGLPELITHSHQAYETLALDLATHPQKLSAIRNTLMQNRLTCPLFNTARFTKHIENAYAQMWERSQAGLLPCDIYVST